MQTKSILRFFYGMGAVLVAAMLWFTTAQPVQVLPRIRLAPGYVLQDASGKSISSENRRGKLTLYTFAYTRCVEDCQPIFDSLRSIQQGLDEQPERSPALNIIILTVDPVYDIPAQIALADNNWTWLTGSEKWIKSIVGGGFDVLYQEQEDGSIFFAPRYVLVDGEGVVRSIYPGARLNAKQFLNHLDIVYKEIAQSTGTARLAYEAAHFFACYPH